MYIIMFAIIGVTIHPHWLYWVAFGWCCLLWLASASHDN